MRETPKSRDRPAAMNLLATVALSALMGFWNGNGLGRYESFERVALNHTSVVVISNSDLAGHQTSDRGVFLDCATICAHRRNPRCTGFQVVETMCVQFTDEAQETNGSLETSSPPPLSAEGLAYKKIADADFECSHSEGFSVVGTPPHTYCLKGNRWTSNYSQAVDYCESIGAHVMFANSSEKLLPAIVLTGVGSFVWIGAVFDPSESVWKGVRDGDELQNDVSLFIAHIQHDEPADYPCVKSRSGWFQTANCSDSDAFSICEKDGVF